MGLLNVAYCDESEDKRDPKVLAVSGYLGKAPDWFELGRRWQSALKEWGLKDFHMSKCESKNTPYDGMDRHIRDCVQRSFIDIIRGAPLYGLASAIELQYYDEIINDIERKRGNFYKPYYLAVQHVIEGMSMVLEKAVFPRDEPIAFVFDQQKEYQCNAKDIYDSVKRPSRFCLSYIGLAHLPSITVSPNSSYRPLTFGLMKVCGTSVK